MYTSIQKWIKTGKNGRTKETCTLTQRPHEVVNRQDDTHGEYRQHTEQENEVALQGQVQAGIWTTAVADIYIPAHNEITSPP